MFENYSENRALLTHSQALSQLEAEGISSLIITNTFIQNKLIGI